MTHTSGRGRSQRDVNARSVLSIAIAGIALAAATFLGSSHLKMHGRYQCDPIPGHPGHCYVASSYWLVGRYGWQIPVAIVVGVVGVAAAVAVARRT